VCGAYRNDTASSCRHGLGAWDVQGRDVTGRVVRGRRRCGSGWRTARDRIRGPALGAGAEDHRAQTDAVRAAEATKNRAVLDCVGVYLATGSRRSRRMIGCADLQPAALNQGRRGLAVRRRGFERRDRCRQRPGVSGGGVSLAASRLGGRHAAPRREEFADRYLGLNSGVRAGRDCRRRRFC